MRRARRRPFSLPRTSFRTWKSSWTTVSSWLRKHSGTDAVGELLGTFRRYTFTPGADVTIPAGDGLYHPSVVNGAPNSIRSTPLRRYRGVLERAGIVCSDLRGETLNLEDAFIGLTGKY